MSAVIAGTSSGFLMASVFASIGTMALFSVVRDPPPGILPVFARIPPATIAMSVVILAYPVWGVIGVLLGLTYTVSSDLAAGGGMGSPNLMFTASVVVAATMVAVPLGVALKRVRWSVLVMTLAFIGLFGWFLPIFAD